MSPSPTFIAARGGKRLRMAVFDAAGARARGVCVLLSGQTEFIEKYVEVIGELASRGFKVAALDWRGQGGSHRDLADPLKVHIGDFTEYDEDLALFMGMAVRPMSERPPIVLAHSMGGHILLRTLNAKPTQFAAAVLTAPMIGVQTRGHHPLVARAACAMQNLVGRKDGWVWGMQARDPLRMGFADQMVTSDAARFRRTQDFIAAHPEIRLTGPTWGWLEAAYRSMARMTVPGFAEKITTPVLVLGAGKDRIVDTAATARFAKRLPNGTYIEFADSEHEILMENDSIRACFWQAFDGFVGKYV